MSDVKPDEADSSPEPILSEFADDAEMFELIAYFIDELQDRVRLISEAWQAGDLEGMRTIAHRLRGAAGGYGFPSITDAAADLEDAIRAGQSEASAMAEKVEALIQLCRRASAGE